MISVPILLICNIRNNITKPTSIYVSGQWRVQFFMELLCGCESSGTVSHILYLFFLPFQFNMNNITEY